MQVMDLTKITVRMNREGRTCIVSSQDPPCVVRMQSGPLRVEALPASIVSEFPLDLLTDVVGKTRRARLEAAAFRYHMHAALEGSTPQCYRLLSGIYEPDQTLRHRIETRLHE